MNTFMKTVRARRAALRECEQARRELRDSIAAIGASYAAHPLPVLGAAAGVGLVSAQFRGGRRLLRVAVRVGRGPAWRLLRQLIESSR